MRHQIKTPFVWVEAAGGGGFSHPVQTECRAGRNELTKINIAPEKIDFNSTCIRNECEFIFFRHFECVLVFPFNLISVNFAAVSRKRKTKRVILSAMRGVIRGKGFSLISHDERK